MPSLSRHTPWQAEWRILRALTLYRVFLLTLLITLLESGASLQIFDKVDGQLFRHFSHGYAVAALLLLLLLVWRRPSLRAQAGLQFTTDALALTALVHATGGVDAGLGILHITPIVAASLVLTPRMALVCAAGATLLMFGECMLRQLLGRPISAAEWTSTGLLGLVLFATCLGASAVAARARKSEALAARADDELASLSRLNESILETMQTGVLVVDREDQIRLANSAALRLLGLHQLTGRRLNEVARPLSERLQAWRSGSAVTHRPLLPRGDAAEVVPRFSHLGPSDHSPVLALLDDSGQLQEQARQLKLASLGRLSASIAHEIRNPLAAMTHAGQLLAEDPSLSPEQQRLLDIIGRHGARIDRIVRDVLDLARRAPQTPPALNLAESLNRIRRDYLEAPTHHDRIILLEPVPGDWRVRFHPEHLEQVLHNLWDNSAEHASRPHVIVTLVAGRDQQTPWLDILDDGPGIPHELRDRVFEPFVTTAAQGTGLGLYLARELCELSHAQLLYLPQRTGARFRILFSSAA